MDYKESAAQFPIRKAIALARAGLDAAGHADVDISESWVNEDREDLAFSIDVPLAADLVLPVIPLDNRWEVEPDVAAERFAEQLVKALPNVVKARRMLKAYRSKVHRHALSAIGAARADGLDVLLESVELKPTFAWHLAYDDWKESAFHVLAVVRVRNLSFYLRPEVSNVIVEEAEHVEDELQDLFEDQRARQRSLLELRLQGADLRTEQVTIDLLQAFGLDPVEVLRRTWREQCVNMKVKRGDEELNLSVTSGNGSANASIAIDRILWNGELMWLAGRFPKKRRREVPGLAVTEVVDFPAFASLRILDEVLEPGIDRSMLIVESPALLFDAYSGRLWPDPRA